MSKVTMSGISSYKSEELVPAGWYPVRVNKAPNIHTSAKGKDVMFLEVTITDVSASNEADPDLVGRVITDMFVLDISDMNPQGQDLQRKHLKNALDSFQVDTGNDSFELEDFLEKEALAQVNIRMNKDLGEEQNSIKRYKKLS